MEKMRVRLTFIEEVLGTANNNAEVYSEFIASKMKGNVPEKDRAEKEKEELSAIGIEEAIGKQMTVFPRNEMGEPIFWDYQFKGFFKDSCSALQRCKGADEAKESCKLKAYKKIIDGCIFVEPREILIEMPDGGQMGKRERPLRANTPMGERIALANSETIPKGSSVDIVIVCLSKEYVATVLEWLEYGRFKGMGQWRNSGCGRFWYELLDDNGKVVGGNKPVDEDGTKAKAKAKAKAKTKKA